LSKITSKQNPFIKCFILQFDFTFSEYYVELESEFGKEVKQTVVMALKRLTEELDFRLNKINKVIKNIGEITVALH
jgi:hypothetical protein